jgi:hypothetical protein
MIAVRKPAYSHPYVGSGSASDGANAATILLQNERFDVAPLALAYVKVRLEALKGLAPNWDGHGSAKPDAGAIEVAVSALSEFFRGAALTQYGWSNPHVSANEGGGIVLEWWRDPRKLTVYVTSTDLSYIRVWGDDVETEMDEGNLTVEPRLDFGAVWSWLNS